MPHFIRNLLFISLICFVFISCSKGDSPQDPPSSEKSLNGVVFKASDNPGLLEDITGTITGDSVKVKFPSTISLTSLVPTIDYAGASITPANRSPQNFTNPISYRITAQDGTISIYGFSSSYRTLNDSVTMILGKWGIIKDSVVNTGYYLQGCGSPNPGVYIGVPADYCDFNADGKAYLFGNNNLSSSPYQILPGRIRFIGCAITEPAIQYLSATRLTLYWSYSNSSGGIYTQTLYLKKS
ncbi:MAG TPA: hypothetical protein VFF27_05980 [Bacteroidia bacterium]|nr:hypothetical protein [Bacteroidia bacterium]